MIFSSTFFLCYFLPALLLIYFLVPRSFKNIVLLIGSILFYAWGAPKFIFILIGTTVIDFFLVRSMDGSKSDRNRKLLLALSIAMNLGFLIYFKYSNFFIDNFNAVLHKMGVTGEIHWTKIVLPIGISFYTFEAMTYMIDVYRRVHAPLNSFFDYLLYIILFPKLIAGPIIRYHELADQITDRSERDNVTEKLMGFYRFCIGLGKKVLIANTLAQFVDATYGSQELGIDGILPEYLSAGTLWLAALAYTFQIYFDFSGYCDMAIGIGRMLGFKFPENFNNPYISESITEFWRRWHMTLGSWMRNYLYIPLGGNQRGTGRMYVNLWIVFLISGLWHGASWTFIVWGIWHGSFLVAERFILTRITSKLGRTIRIITTFFVVLIGWVAFRAPSIAHLKGYIKGMFFMTNGTQQIEFDRQFVVVLIIAILFAFFCIPKTGQRIQDKIYSGTLTDRTHIGFTAGTIVVLIIALSYVTASGYNPFIYFQF
jgi:alginate O-acetyltransferase complex protein AlgI